MISLGFLAHIAHTGAVHVRPAQPVARASMSATDALAIADAYSRWTRALEQK